MWVESLLKEVGSTQQRMPMFWCDNLGATYLMVNPVFLDRTNQIEIDLHFVHERVATSPLDIMFISTHD
jgi:hypothetical protein